MKGKYQGRAKEGPKGNQRGTKEGPKMRLYNTDNKAVTFLIFQGSGVLKC